MDFNNINKVIKVGVVFEGGKVLPRWFLYDNRKHEIKTVNYQWEDREGIENILMFSVSDDANSYEISFNLKRLIWKLEKTFITL